MSTQERAKKSKSGIKRKCEVCVATLYVFPYQLKMGYGRFCSRSCKSKWIVTTNNYKSGQKRRKGLPAHPNTIIANQKKCGELCYQWKGENVGYRALHNWVERLLGKPSVCSVCKDNTKAHRQYHWANLSGKYYRDISDWARMCASCHCRYDNKKKVLLV